MAKGFIQLFLVAYLKLKFKNDQFYKTRLFMICACVVLRVHSGHMCACAVWTGSPTEQGVGFELLTEKPSVP